MKNVASKSYSVELVIDGEPPNAVATRTIGEYPTVTRAFAAAKKAAGRGAEFITRGVDRAYAGPNGTAWISRVAS